MDKISQNQTLCWDGKKALTFPLNSNVSFHTLNLRCLETLLVFYVDNDNKRVPLIFLTSIDILKWQLNENQVLRLMENWTWGRLSTAATKKSLREGCKPSDHWLLFWLLISVSNSIICLRWISGYVEASLTYITYDNIILFGQCIFSLWYTLEINCI